VIPAGAALAAAGLRRGVCLHQFKAANVEGTWNEHMRDLRELEWASPGEGRVASLEL
jgi:hypothetical protein